MILYKKNKIALMLIIVMILSMVFLTACSEKVENDDASNAITTDEDKSLYISLEEAKNSLESEDSIFVDARLSDAYNGWALDGIHAGGHIPGAVDFPYNWLSVDLEDRAEELSKILADKGITKDKRIIIYDVKGTEALAVHEYLKGEGYDNLFLFDLKLWVEDNTFPLEKFSHYEKIVPAVIVHSILEGETPETFEESRNIKIVEASWGTADNSYAKGHIPGAIHINTDLVEPEPEWMLAELSLLKAFALDYGFTTDDTVIVTGAEQMAAYRVAVILEYMGVSDVRVLNGGLSAWEQGGYTIDTESYEPTPVESFGGEIPMNPELIMSIEELKVSLSSDDHFTLVDNRTWEEHIGESSGYSYHDKKGRIPGAVYGYAGVDNAYSLKHFRNIDNTMRNPEEIKALWLAQGIDLENELAFMCGSGWRAAEILTYAQVMGLKDTVLYSDGWIGWSNDPENPIVTGVPQ